MNSANRIGDEVSMLTAWELRSLVARRKLLVDAGVLEDIAAGTGAFADVIALPIRQQPVKVRRLEDAYTRGVCHMHDHG